MWVGSLRAVEGDYFFRSSKESSRGIGGFFFIREGEQQREIGGFFSMRSEGILGSVLGFFLSMGWLSVFSNQGERLVHKELFL